MGSDHHTIASALLWSCPLIIFVSRSCCCFFFSQHFQNYVWSEEFFSYILMVFYCMILGPVICIVQFSWSPVYVELFMAFSISWPVKTHVHCFREFMLDFSIDNRVCHCVIRLQWHWWLFVSHFFKDDANLDCFSCHDVEGG